MTLIRETFNTELNGVPKEFTKSSGNGKSLLIQKGQLNKWQIRPQVLNEHVESSREVQSSVGASTIVGQIFKASKDNINGISLTMESASGVSLDDFESHESSAALQSVWVASGSLATLETTIVKSGTNSMAMSGGILSDSWIDTIASTDYTDYVFSFDFYQDELYSRLKYEFTIGDGTNTATFSIVSPEPDAWHKFEIDINFMVNIGAVNTAAITKIGLIVVDRDAGDSGYIDNLIATPPAGSVEVKLWDMGASIPVTSVTSLDDGSQYTELGDRGINGGTVDSQVSIHLQGGKKQYQLNTFAAGTAPEIPSNTTLTINNYYAITIHYVDTDVDIYGPNTSFITNYYTNGYAFTTPDTSTAITSIGTYSDLMFQIFSTQDVYVIQYFQVMVNSSGGISSAGVNSSIIGQVEDENMNIENIITTQVPTATNITIDLSLRPVKIPKGGKYEIHLNDDFTDDIFAFGGSIGWLYEPPTVNG